MVEMLRILSTLALLHKINQMQHQHASKIIGKLRVWMKLAGEIT